VQFAPHEMPDVITIESPEFSFGFVEKVNVTTPVLTTDIELIVDAVAPQTLLSLYVTQVELDWMTVISTGGFTCMYAHPPESTFGHLY